MPIEIDSLGHSCDASIHFLSSVLISSEFATSLLALLVKNFATRETEVSTFPCAQTEKDVALARCRSIQRVWRNETPVLTLSAVTDEEGHPLENEDESGRRLCEYWGTIFQARQEGPRHFQHEETLRFVQQAPNDINWTIDRAEFDDLLASKKDSAPGPDGIPYGVYRCAGGLGSKFLFNAYQAVLEGRNISDCFAESRTVFIPKTSDTNDLGRIIRSPDALRPLHTVQLRLQTPYICYLSRPSQRCISRDAPGR